MKRGGEKTLVDARVRTVFQVLDDFVKLQLVGQRELVIRNVPPIFKPVNFDTRLGFWNFRHGIEWNLTPKLRVRASSVPGKNRYFRILDNLVNYRV